MSASEILEQIAEEVKKCERCELHRSRKNAVPGEGPANSKIIFIGEGPGFYENQQGRPFVGAAGKFLDELLASAGLKRNEVFIANVVKCRPPGNRDPQIEELTACSAFLDRQIEAINPRIIVTLGRFSMAKYLPDAKISRIHGNPQWVKDRLIVPMYHPAAALHQPSLRATVIEDFRRLPEWVQKVEKRMSEMSEIKNLPEKRPEENAEDDPTQLSLF